MNDIPNLPPRPWTFTTTAEEHNHAGAGHVYLIDASGRKIACMWGKAAEKVALANFICDAGDWGAPPTKDIGS